MVAHPDPGLLPAARVTKALDASTNAQQQLKVKPQAQVSWSLLCTYIQLIDAQQLKLKLQVQVSGGRGHCNIPQS